MSVIARELARLKKAASSLTKDLSNLEGIVHEGEEAIKTADEQRIILIEEMAAILNVSLPTVRRWLHDGRLEPHYKKGRTYYWLRSDLNEILRNSNSEAEKK